MDFKKLLERKREARRHVDRIQKYINNPDAYVYDLDFINEVKDAKVLQEIVKIMANNSWSAAYSQRRGF